ncbi:AAA family ATPase [Psychrobacillus sp. Sa2BUA9]|uniref:AAA family ATPase n=1 Tax=Psychrobacillus faecigallinarum TaxID=2762235 RepID=A0ABR8RDU6_9BACI|nr:AAA family ATPase [Psychrobacillus faecigallinarum]MBD7945968.1 AAA family ATPase [Psychrobacillus faecigallinarum]
MNLIFVWIEEYKKIRNFQTNFGSKYIIEFKEKQISVKPNNHFVEDFFEVDKSDINIHMSAIVGENGTGKSTLLDFILEYIQKGSFENGYITIFEDMGKLYIDTNIDVRIEDKSNIVSLKDESLDPILGNLVTIFFSNVFDVRYFDNKNRNIEVYENELKDFGNPRLKDLPSIMNITTNELLATYDNAAMVLDADSTNQIFFSNEYLDTLEIGKMLELPNKIFIKNGKQNINLSMLSEKFEKFINDFSFDDVANMYFNFQPDNELIDTLTLDILKNYCIEVAKVLRKYPDLHEDMVEEAFFYGSNDSDIIKIIYKGILKVLKLLQVKNLSEIKSKLNSIGEKYTTLLELTREIKIYKGLNETHYLINDEATSKFIKYYRENFYSQGLISLHWSDMSSGQLGLLNLFGRFYNALHEVEEDLLSSLNEMDLNEEYFEMEDDLEKFTVSDKLKDYNYLLLLDECDLYFHPQWQKDWLYYFLRLIEILFKGNVQVILTTHSPFVLSDFPNSNVTFLSKSSLTKNDLEGSIRTFGANINELFTNSFFISDGLMGKFAKNKINGFIKEFLNATPNEVDANKEKYKQFIDLIGEPLIKNKLLQIYNEKVVLASNNSIEYRIKYLESELNKIKNRSDKID